MTAIDETVPISQVVLKQLQVGSQVKIPRQILHTLTIEERVDDVFGQIVYELRAMIPAEQLKDEEHTVSFKRPRTWWQHLKHTYLPDWLLRRFPVRWDVEIRKFDVKTYALYPELPMILSPDQYGHTIRRIRTITERE